MMTPTILKAIENSSTKEVFLTTREFIEGDMIKVLAELRPDMESLTIEYPDNEAIRFLSLFPKLRKLFINQVVTLSEDNEWLKYVCSLTELTHLSLQSFENLDYQALSDLTCLKNLIYLNFSFSGHIFDDYFELFSKFESLRYLNINNSDYLTDEGMPGLASLSNLEGLEFAYAIHVSNSGLQLLGCLKQLKYLNLCGTKISDEGLKPFASLTHLEFINLIQCEHITEKGLLFLKRLPKLREIYIGNSLQLSNEIILQIQPIQIIQDKDAWKLWDIKMNELNEC